VTRPCCIAGEIRRMTKIILGLLVVISRGLAEPSTPKLVRLPGCKALCRDSIDSFRFFGCESCFHGTHDRFRNFRLDGEDIFDVEFLVVGFCPQMGLVRRVDELNIDPHSVTGSLYTTFKDGCHAKLFGDLPNGYPSVAILFYGGPGDDGQCVHG